MGFDVLPGRLTPKPPIENMPKPNVQRESSGWKTTATVGRMLTPESLRVSPDSAPKLDPRCVVRYRSSAPITNSELSSPVIEAGFQWMAPAASSGAATPAPAIERFTGPAPGITIP